MIPFKVKRCRFDAKLPTRATDGSAGFDFYALESAYLTAFNDCTIRLGVAVELPPGFVLLLFSRSGHALKHRVRLGNCVGVIDSDYRGELVAQLSSDNADSDTMKDQQCSRPNFAIKPGDRICQGVILRLPEVQLIEVDELTDTERGTGGHGSTGA